MSNLKLKAFDVETPVARKYRMLAIRYYYSYRTYMKRWEDEITKELLKKEVENVQVLPTKKEVAKE